jgi:haloacetate dehalogenase
MAFFQGFELITIDAGEGEIRLRHGGSGPPLLLVHGNPQTHAMWHKVAPELAKTYHVICPDLRGYGGSHKPPATKDHAPYSKRAMARDLVGVMHHFGHETFYLAGHDRGARVSHRLTLDHPQRVRKLAVLDIIPTLAHFERTDMAFALGYYHWFWLAQPHPFPETIICANPDDWFRAHTSREPKSPDFFAPEALADYMAFVRTPDMIRGMCEDYRAAITIDLEHDRESRAHGRKIQCPLLALWGSKAKIETWYDAPSIWSSFSNGPVSGRSLPSGHYVPEEAPAEVIAEFKAFFRE